MIEDLGYRFQIMSVANKTIERVRVEKIPKERIQTERSNIMSGHSKFANIKHKKKKRCSQGKDLYHHRKRDCSGGKGWGADPNNNSRLRDVIAKAKANNMPNDTIDRGDQKGGRRCQPP